MSVGLPLRVLVAAWGEGVINAACMCERIASAPPIRRCAAYQEVRRANACAVTTEGGRGAAGGRLDLLAVRRRAASWLSAVRQPIAHDLRSRNRHAHCGVLPDSAGQGPARLARVVLTSSTSVYA